MTFAFRSNDETAAGGDGVRRVTLIGDCCVVSPEDEEEEERDVVVSVEWEDGREVLVIEAREDESTVDGETVGEALECLHAVLLHNSRRYCVITVKLRRIEMSP